MDGRSVRRIEAMRRAQDAALQLFEERGFASVTIEEIATVAGTSPATIYRNFTTKERLVLWDEYNPMLFEEIRKRLPRYPLLDAVQQGLVASLDQVYAADATRILRRARLISAEKALMTASAGEQAETREGLIELFRSTRVITDPLALQVVAGAVLVALEAAVSLWVQEQGRTPLKGYLQRAFQYLGALTVPETQPEGRTESRAKTPKPR